MNGESVTIKLSFRNVAPVCWRVSVEAMKSKCTVGSPYVLAPRTPACRDIT